MADRIRKSYKFSKRFYDDALTQSKWWSRLHFKLLWGGVDDNQIAGKVLGYIPDDFSGRLLDVPVGTAVFTVEKYTTRDRGLFAYQEKTTMRFRGQTAYSV